MLKIVGSTNDIIEDEKVLIDDDDKLTGYGIAAIAGAALMLVGLFAVLRALFGGRD